MVALKPITKDNFYEVVKLNVDETQKNFVASNVFSLAQAWLYGKVAHPFAIYADDVLVGFFMGGTFEKDGGTEYYIWRLMVDSAHQHKGYGRAALRLAVDYFRQMGAKEVGLSYEPDNDVAGGLYASEGFVLTGKVDDDGEVEAVLTLA